MVAGLQTIKDNQSDLRRFARRRRRLTEILAWGLFEIALPFRVVYVMQLGEDIWVVHAFQKKSTQGIKTPKREIDLVKDGLKRLKEMSR
ncbi:MAG TPA: type II toxin-antitoxin system RelE/ParE family toxin [Pyrinomonadaceae bacterium]